MCPEHSRCSTNLGEMNFLIDELFSNMFVIIFKDKVNLFPNFIFLGRKYTLWGKSKKKKTPHTTVFLECWLTLDQGSAKYKL